MGERHRLNRWKQMYRTHAGIAGLIRVFQQNGLKKSSRARTRSRVVQAYGIGHVFQHAGLLPSLGFWASRYRPRHSHRWQRSETSAYPFRLCRQARNTAQHRSLIASKVFCQPRARIQRSFTRISAPANIAATDCHHRGCGKNGSRTAGPNVAIGTHE